MNINIVIEQMIQLFLIIFLGVFIAKKRIVDSNFAGKFTTLILNVTMPCMILSSVLGDVERLPLINLIVVISIAVVLYVLVIPIFAFIYVKITRVPENNQGLYIFMSIFSNIGFMGFPVISAIYGNTALFYTAIFNLVFNIVLFTAGLPIMNYNTEKNSKFDLSCFKTPGIISAVLAMVIYVLNISFPSALCDAVDTVGKMTTPGAMLLIGIALSKINIKAIFSDIRLYCFSIVKQFVIPIVLWIVLKNIITDQFILGITLVLLSMPVANVAVLFATEYKNDEVLAAKGVFITTLISIITTPAVLYICLNILD